MWKSRVTRSSIFHIIISSRLTCFWMPLGSWVEKPQYLVRAWFEVGQWGVWTSLRASSGLGNWTSCRKFHAQICFKHVESQMHLQTNWHLWINFWALSWGSSSEVTQEYTIVIKHRHARRKLNVEISTWTCVVKPFSNVFFSSSTPMEATNKIRID